MCQHYSEVQALKEENERLKRQIKEQAVAASTYAMPPPQHFGDKYHDLKKQDQGVRPPDHTRPMFNKPRTNSVQLPIVVPTPEKSYSGSHPEQPHVQTRTFFVCNRVRPHASVASGVRGGKPGSKPTTPVPPARLSLQARPTSESPRVMFQPTVNGAVAQNQFRAQPQPQYPQLNAHPMVPSNVTQMSNQMCGPQHQHQHQHQHHQSPSFQSPSVINRHYQVSSAPTPAPVPQYSLQHQTPHPSYPNRIPQSFDTPIGIYCTPADPGVGQPRSMIARPGASFPSARATWQQQAQIGQQHHHQQTQQTHQMQNQYMAPQQVMMNPFTGPPMPNTARHPIY
ncbi:MAG: hypothetical protein BYD32DRAFT_271381 [Podila humilis]|nr:MAG: hypothetical protein BYD32DRAFT_271381 [Podila humilis]